LNVFFSQVTSIFKILSNSSSIPASSSPSTINSRPHNSIYYNYQS